MADDDFETGDLFQDPEGFYPEEEKPTFAEHQMLSGKTVRVRLVGSHPLYGNLLWNAGRTSSHYIEEHSDSLLRDRDVLEIGAAAGVPSIVSAILGARTVVMTDYHDPDLVSNMQYNADLAADMIPASPAHQRLSVEGYKWGNPVEPLLAHIPPAEEGKPSGFDLLIMADVVYSWREHGNLVKTMQETLKKDPASVALVIFTPYQPWLLPQTERFFPLAEAGGFTVTKIFEKLMGEVLFENDPGDERLRRTVFGYELRWAPEQLESHARTPREKKKFAAPNKFPNHTMPLVILTGYPCSGLTYRANQLASLIEKSQDGLFATAETGSTIPLKSRFKVHVVTSHDSSHPRIVYDHARTEKEARGVAYARAKRVLTRDSIVILDGMNYIKGWRYQLWCEAKAAGTTCCVVHVGTPVDQCVANNDARLKRQAALQGTSESPETQDISADKTPDSTISTDTEEPYPSDLLNNLIFRYEEPSTHSRWDKPLFTVPWSDTEPPVADIFHALTGVDLRPEETETETPISMLTSTLASSTISSAASVATSARTFTRGGASGGSIRPRIVPHQATVQSAPTDPSALYGMEKRTSAIVSAIRAFTQANPSAEVALAQSSDLNGIVIAVPDASIPIFVPVHVAMAGTTDELAGAGGVLALPKLQRLRRQWISLNRTYIGHGHGAGNGGLAADQIGDAFVRFLNSALDDKENV
ncbi:RNA polymerase II Elongator complex associated protein Kti12 [Penicillium taxi]|uniref:RNA polymerase II Elongator complex associated protein Kti12 n=1 Tax=Penicillium taxi TaxID=168475 RepID=UPI00254577A0|nr:RNA polymerase II Elongator complex associated protein Kti12 [Penicillium taxi]KAJ5884780.1 RNA polymerase II Elongator complex associated protein Kti12 [Penicillium taxi]